jgi:hypothetical protein
MLDSPGGTVRPEAGILCRDDFSGMGGREFAGGKSDCLPEKSIK